MDDNWLEEVHRCMRRLEGVCFELDMLGHAFEIVGNSKVADDLQGMAREVHDSKEKIGTVIHRMIDAEFKAGQQAIADTFKAILEILPKDGEG